MTYYSIQIYGVESYTLGKGYIRISFVSKEASKTCIDILIKFKMNYNDLSDESAVIVYNQFSELRYCRAIPDMLDLDFLG